MIDFPLPISKCQQLAASVDVSYRPLIEELCKKAESKGGFIRVRLDLPSRQKTSPENRLFHALVAQLAMYRETSPDLMKRYVKIRACAHDYPYSMMQEPDRDGYEEIFNGTDHEVIPSRKIKTYVEPKSVADASTVEVAILIETCYLVAHEWAVELKQEGI
jgi:hypothetical protein